MSSQLDTLSTRYQVESITKRLVEINSVNGTRGEAKLIDEAYRILSDFSYFSQHPDNLWVQKITGDSVGRENLFAFIEGGAETANTIIYHSHIDTVGVEDYGVLKENAFSPDTLQGFFASYQSDKEAQKDALSGDWMFGRGALDMKSGAAVHITNMLYFSEHVNELEGNILLILNGDEEGEHIGIRSALSELQRLQEEKELEYVTAINADFITPLYDGDENKYIYTGTAGKVLPCFHIYGREVHVGDTLSGIDPNFIAAKITERIHNNYRLTEVIPGELMLPPTCLYQRDTKKSYTVQTAPSSRLYFNYFLYEDTPGQVLDQLMHETKAVCAEAEQYLRNQFENYLRISRLPSRSLTWDIDVTTYAQYVEELEKKGIATRPVIEKVLAETETTDLRELSFEIVGALQDQDPAKKARVIIFFAAPFLPHNYLQVESEMDQQLQASIEEVLREVQTETGETFSVKKFFPYLADGSFLSIHETPEQLASLVNNFPEWDSLYPLPFDAIKQFNIPSINMGVYGKDGHKWTERVYKPYSFETLPLLIRKTTTHLLKQNNRVRDFS